MQDRGQETLATQFIKKGRVAGGLAIYAVCVCMCVCVVAQLTDLEMKMTNKTISKSNIFLHTRKLHEMNERFFRFFLIFARNLKSSATECRYKLLEGCGYAVGG